MRRRGAGAGRSGGCRAAAAGGGTEHENERACCSLHVVPLVSSVLRRDRAEHSTAPRLRTPLLDRSASHTTPPVGVPRAPAARAVTYTVDRAHRNHSGTRLTPDARSPRSRSARRDEVAEHAVRRVQHGDDRAAQRIVLGQVTPSSRCCGPPPCAASTDTITMFASNARIVFTPTSSKRSEPSRELLDGAQVRHRRRRAGRQACS